MALGCYTPPYLPGSFRGVPFKVEEATSEHGRRGAEGEFPFGEQTAYADLGRRIRRYKLSARFDQNDHVVRAAALIAACELTGSGVLVHPTRGVILSAACKSLTVVDKPEESGGVTQVDMEFIEANNWPNGLSLVGTILGLVLSPILISSRASFSANYKPDEIQLFRKEAVVNTLQTQVGNIADQYAEATLESASAVDRNRIVYDLRSVETSNTLAGDISVADRAVVLGMNAVSLVTSGTSKYERFRTLANGAAGASTYTSPASLAEDAVYSLVRTLSAAYMAQGALESDEFRTGQILEQLDAIETILDEEILYARTTCQNELHENLKTFKVSALSQIADKAYNSPGLRQYDFGGQVHPLVAAYSIHGDAKRHREIETLNVLGSKGRIGTTVNAVGR